MAKRSESKAQAPVVPIQAALGTLKASGTGWRTSEGQMTAAAGLVMAAGKLAEALGWIPDGTSEGLTPLAALVGTYVLGRTGLKIVRERKSLQSGEVGKWSA